MFVRECMTNQVELATPSMSVLEAACRMRDGDFGVLPVAEKDRLIGMVTDRDITVRAVAEGKDPEQTMVRDIMSSQVLYCYEDQTVDEVSKNMGDQQVRRLPVLDRNKRLVGILSIGDIAIPEKTAPHVAEALSQISRHEHHEPQFQPH